MKREPLFKRESVSSDVAFFIENEILEDQCKSRLSFRKGGSVGNEPNSLQSARNSYFRVGLKIGIVRGRKKKVRTVRFELTPALLIAS